MVHRQALARAQRAGVEGDPPRLQLGAGLERQDFAVLGAKQHRPVSHGRAGRVSGSSRTASDSGAACGSPGFRSSAKPGRDASDGQGRIAALDPPLLRPPGFQRRPQAGDARPRRRGVRPPGGGADPQPRRRLLPLHGLQFGKRPADPPVVLAGKGPEIGQEAPQAPVREPAVQLKGDPQRQGPVQPGKQHRELAQVVRPQLQITRWPASARPPAPRRPPPASRTRFRTVAPRGADTRVRKDPAAAPRPAGAADRRAAPPASRPSSSVPAPRAGRAGRYGRPGAARTGRRRPDRGSGWRPPPRGSRAGAGPGSRRSGRPAADGGGRVRTGPGNTASGPDAAPAGSARRDGSTPPARRARWRRSPASALGCRPESRPAPGPTAAPPAAPARTAAPARAAVRSGSRSSTTWSECAGRTSAGVRATATSPTSRSKAASSNDWRRPPNRKRRHQPALRHHERVLVVGGFQLAAVLQARPRAARQRVQHVFQPFHPRREPLHRPFLPREIVDSTNYNMMYKNT